MVATTYISEYWQQPDYIVVHLVFGKCRESFRCISAVLDRPAIDAGSGHLSDRFTHEMRSKMPAACDG